MSPVSQGWHLGVRQKLQIDRVQGRFYLDSGSLGLVSLLLLLLFLIVFETNLKNCKKAQFPEVTTCYL